MNFVFRDKESGLIVDYIDLARALKDAMKAYTNHDQKKWRNVHRQNCFAQVCRKLRVCRELFHGFNYAAFFSDVCNDRQRADMIAAGINHMFSLAYARQTQSLCINIAPEEDVSIRRFPMMLDADFLATLADRVAGSVTVQGKQGDLLLFEAKRVFVEQIAQITWCNKLAAGTLNVATGAAVTELEVFEVKLNQPTLDTRVLQRIDQQIPTTSCTCSRLRARRRRGSATRKRGKVRRMFSR